ncbi:uncharacterized protein LOC128388894 [Panonychus citri]|uniref:uncharacterized protein LOC128388894 n=1 Tax=Panonychus citri TaxID=50023 RepID=UPI0023074000|nr:uncharacterized protein LOC128388894 [Panonychus citri]
MDSKLKALNPSSIVTRSLLKGKRSQLISSLIISIAYLGNGIFNVIMGSSKNGKDFGKKYRFISGLYNIFLSATISYQTWNRHTYVKFIEENQKILSTNFSKSRQILEEIRYYPRIIIYIMMCSSSIIALGLFPYYTYNILYEESPIYYIMILIFTAMNALSWVLTKQMIIESCLFLRGSFVLISYLISDVKQDSKAERRIKLIRHVYEMAAQTTHKLDVFFSVTIFGGYLYILINSFSFFVELAHRTEMFIVYSAQFIDIIISTAHVTYHLVSINHFAKKCYDQVYELSFKITSPEAHNEINLFLERAGRANIGLSFVKIYLITPSFVTMMGSILLSMALAAPGLVAEG